MPENSLAVNPKPTEKRPTTPVVQNNAETVYPISMNRRSLIWRISFAPGTWQPVELSAHTGSVGGGRCHSWLMCRRKSSTAPAGAAAFCRQAQKQEGRTLGGLLEHLGDQRHLSGASHHCTSRSRRPQDPGKKERKKLPMEILFPEAQRRQL